VNLEAGAIPRHGAVSGQPSGCYMEDPWGVITRDKIAAECSSEGVSAEIRYCIPLRR